MTFIKNDMELVELTDSKEESSLSFEEDVLYEGQYRKETERILSLMVGYTKEVKEVDISLDEEEFKDIEKELLNRGDNK